MQIGGMVKTTLEIPRKLLDEAMSAGKFSTRTATIVGALEQFVRSIRLAELRNMRGAMPKFDLNLDVLRSR